MTVQRSAEVKDITRILEPIQGKLAERVASLIERGIYNRTIAMARIRNVPQFWSEPFFVELYSNISYMVKMNLDPESSINHGQSYIRQAVHNWVVKKQIKSDNPIVKRILDFFAPAIAPHTLAELSPSELNPDANKVYLEELELRSQQHVEVKYVTRHKCRQCGERKTQEYEINSRRGDEGGTLHIICMSCYHRWRING